MQDLENNNWIILDPLENIYEIYVNLNVMNLNQKLNYVEKAHLQKQVSCSLPFLSDIYKIL